jgi:DNA-binding CsgD family transcriptional regulator
MGMHSSNGAAVAEIAGAEVPDVLTIRARLAQLPAALRQSDMILPHSSSPASPSSAFSTASRRFNPQSDHDVTLLNMMERLDCGYVIVDQHRKILETNSAAFRMLDRDDCSVAGSYLPSPHVLQELLERGRIRLQAGSLVWIATSLKRGFTVALDHVQDFTTDQTSIVILLNLDIFPTPNPKTLKQLFGLTFAEARLAFHLAQGSTPNEIARILRVSRTTVRSQLGSIFSKTHTKRQAALVALLGRVAVLP